MGPRYQTLHVAVACLAVWLSGCGGIPIPVPRAPVADGDFIRFLVEYVNDSRDVYSLVHVNSSFGSPAGGARIEACSSETLEFLLTAPFVLYLFAGPLDDPATDELMAAGPAGVVNDGRITALLRSDAVPTAAGDRYRLTIGPAGKSTSFFGGEVSAGRGDPC